MTDQYDPNGYTSYGGQPGGGNTAPGSGQGGYGSYGGQGYGQQGTPPPQPYPGTPSQPYPGTPSQPYGGQYGQYGQPGPSSQPYYAQQTAFTQPPAQKPSRRGLKVALIVAGVVLLLGVLGGGAAAVVLSQFGAPGAAALQFCNNLKTQSYDAAYGMLSSDLKSSFSQTDFSTGVSALDTAEGKVTGCQQAQGSNTYSYSLGASTATVKAQITRSTQGNLTGVLHLKNQSGSWKIDGIDSSLLGVNIGALKASGDYCAAMQSHDYATAYNLLDSTAQGQIGKDDFVAFGTLHDQIDGAVTKCTLTKVPAGNTDTLAKLTIDLTRARLGDRSGDITLKFDGTAWKVAASDDALGGTDLRPLVVGQQFCTLLSAAKYENAYALFSSSFKQLITKSEFVAEFSTFNGNALQWTCGAPDIASYKVSGTTASIVEPITLAIPALGSGATSTTKFKVSFVLESNAWKIDDLTDQG
jgi:hypothetical protein